MSRLRGFVARLHFTTKLRLYMMSLVLGLSLLFLTFFVYHIRKAGIQGVERRGITLTQGLAWESELGVLAGDLRFLHIPFDIHYKPDDVAYAMIYNRDGKLLIGKSKLPLGIPPFAESLANLAISESEKKTREFNQFRVYEFIQPIITVEVEEIPEALLFEPENESARPAAPLVSPKTEKFVEGKGEKKREKRVIGYVRLGLYLAQVEADINKIIKLSLFVTGLFLLLSVLTTFLLSKNLTRPIIHLTKGVKAIIAGNLNQHIKLKTQDEFAELAEAFNEMTQRLRNRLEEIRQKNEELLKARSELEIRVEERTADLKVAHEQLIHAEKLGALGKLAASISHEFNNPIYGIKMVLEQLDEETKLNEAERKSVRLAIKECSRISRMINNLIDFYRPSTGVVTTLDIHQAIKEVLQICRKKLALNRVEVVRDFAEDMPRISVVADQIKQVFLNIVTNAEESMFPSGGRLTIQTRVLESKVRIIFKDNGCGIANGNIGKIFDPFFTTKGTVKGSGLGLSVSYGIIKGHGGNIWVESTPNQGSIFTVELPITRQRRFEFKSPLIPPSGSRLFSP